ncbi:MAG TPA: polyphosphate kinase 1 [Chryseolinea sp.]
MKKSGQPKDTFFDRDLSWLSFNARVLAEAQRKTVPLMERLKFLSIYSSNLDEFYRVRMPAIMALGRLESDGTIKQSARLKRINAAIHRQLNQFGKTLTRNILPDLISQGVNLLINQQFAKALRKEIEEIFFQEIAGFIHIVELTGENNFFPENNKLYLATTIQTAEGVKRCYILNIPSDQLPRFYSINYHDTPHIIFLDDIIKSNINKIFPGLVCLSCNSFKITRDAELDLKDEFDGNLAKKIEREIARRDYGLATRFLYDPATPQDTLELLGQQFGLRKATYVVGGTYHNLKDLSVLPLKDKSFFFEEWRCKKLRIKPDGLKLLDYLQRKEILLHPPYHSYDTVLRFFNEAAIDEDVRRIYVTLYRVAKDSRIANAMIQAARNGKKVTVFVELKARFDEANNIKWAKRMKEAGVDIIYSIPELKVHAKLALIKRKKNDKTEYFGLLSTGNFNEGTARFYTDHILMTSNHNMLTEAEELFRFLKKRKKPSNTTSLTFRHLLVAQFNLQARFIELIDREIKNARKGLSASIVIKLNNLEEKVMIAKLYEASRAGVKISLLVRGICCLVPGVDGMSENINVIRIVDRYLEHGRIFIFHNKGRREIFMGSADWMDRNLYRRIEVCFPVYQKNMKDEIIQMINLQLSDNAQAVQIDSKGNNSPVSAGQGQDSLQSQSAINALLTSELKTDVAHEPIH